MQLISSSPKQVMFISYPCFSGKYDLAAVDLYQRTAAGFIKTALFLSQDSYLQSTHTDPVPTLSSDWLFFFFAIHTHVLDLPVHTVYFYCQTRCWITNRFFFFKKTEQVISPIFVPSPNVHQVLDYNIKAVHPYAGSTSGHSFLQKSLSTVDSQCRSILEMRWDIRPMMNAN